MLVKICGITNLDDALAAAAAGAGAIGFNFYRESPRYISHTGAAMIAEKLPESVLKVGVFVDETSETIARIALRVPLDVAQLHGLAECESLRTWRAVAATETFDPETLPPDTSEAFLLDTPSVEVHGGTGRTFPWRRARDVSRRTSKKIVLAGGLDASNVEEAIAEAAPWGVDACSRLESEPGRKDHRKMELFIQAALGAGS